MSDQTPVYRDLPILSDQEIESALASGKPEAISIALLSSGFYTQDAEKAVHQCMKYLDAANPELRRVAVVSLGHIGRRHASTYSIDVAFDAVLRMLKDECPEVADAAENALSDIQIWRFDHYAYMRPQMEEWLAFGTLLDRFGALFAIARRDPDKRYVFETAIQYLQNPHFLLRVAAVWAIFNAWDDVTPAMRSKAQQLVASLLHDSDSWVRDNARRALEYMTDAG